MEYVYAALLLHKTGQPVNEENVKKVLEASGAKVEDGKVKALVSALDGVDIEQAIKEGSVVATIAAPVVEGASQEGAAKSEEKSAEDDKKDEAQAAAGLGSLFG